MCGICGVIEWSGRPVERAALAAMADAIRHRGPDGEGFHLESGEGRASVGLGHRRLAVIDLVTGDQPLANEDGTVWVVFNGEIYNFQELRAELRAAGHTFRSAGDTEVLVHGWEQWGEALVPRLDGMFAFALWDHTQQRLVLARDPAGKKPLYYARTAERIVFGSEIKALRVALGATAAPDLGVLPAYLALGYVPGCATAFTGIRQLPPAHLAVAGPGGGWSERRYWDLPYADARFADAREPADTARIRALVRAAVEKRLVADVPIGALLSGGIDSTAVVATMRELRDEVHTFTVGMSDQEGWDESGYAREVARHLGTVHHEIRVEPDVVKLVETIAGHHDEPFADASAVPTWLISEFARQHVTVVLTGDGGDEVFGGYPRLAVTAHSERVPPVIRALAGAVGGVLGPGRAHDGARARLARMADRLRRPLARRLLSFIRLFDEGVVAELLGGSGGHGGSGVLGEAEAQFDALDARASGSSPLGRALYINFHTYLPDDLLRKMDRASMAVSLEARAPLLDRALMEAVARMNDSAKVDGLTLKAGLRRLIAGRVPREVLSRRKQGFGLPLGRWFREDLREMVGDLLLGPGSRVRELLRRDVIERLYRENLERRRDNGLQLWSLLVLEEWLRGTQRVPKNPLASVPVKVTSATESNVPEAAPK